MLGLLVLLRSSSIRHLKLEELEVDIAINVTEREAGEHL